MSFDPVASARIELELNDDALVQGLQRVEREHARTMREIDRSKAEATIDLDTSHYDDAIKNVKREMKELDGQKATGELDMDDKAFKKKVKELRKELRDLEGQKATIELELRGEDEFKRASKRAQQAAQKDIAATEKAEAQRAKLNEQHERRRQQLAKQIEQAYVREGNLRMTVMRREQQAYRQNEQALIREGNIRAAMMRRQEQENRLRERAAEQRKKELESIPKLQREYADLTVKMDQLAAARRKAFPDKRAQLMVDLKIAETEAKMKALVASLERIGGDVDVRINFKTGAALGADVRKTILAGGGMTGAGYMLGRGIGKGMLKGVTDTFTPKNMAARATNTLSKIGGMLGALSDATVRLGPFTASLRTVMIAMSVLGPTILDLVGTLGALVGVVGTGLVGAMALGAGAVGALGVALGGVGFLLPTLMRDFKNLTSLQDAYHKQVLKTGENSDKAKTKLKEFEHALGEVQPTTKEAFLNLDKLRDRWNKMAQDVKPQFFDAMGASLDLANTRWDWFAKNTKRSFTILSKGWQGWMKALQGDEAGSILETLGSNGRKSLKPLMDALGNLATWFGRISAEASTYLPGLTRKFRDWTKSLADSVAPGENVSGTIGRLVDHTKSLGRFLSSATRFLVSFFNAGADSGQGLLDTLTETLDGWTEFNESADGKNKLKEFFDRSVKGAEALFGALAPIVQTFVAWAEQISPIVTSFLQGAGAVSKFVGGFVRLVGLQDSLSAIVTTLGAIWAVGRIRAATTAVTGFSSALLGLAGKQTIAGAAGARGGLFAELLGMGTKGQGIIGPAQKTWAYRLKSVMGGAIKGAGLIGAGVLIMEMIGKGMKTAAARGGTQSTLLGLSRDVLSTVSFGIVHDASRASEDAAKAIVGSLRRNVNLELDKNIKLNGGKGGANAITTLDLTIDQKKMARQFQLALQKADQLVREHHLPDLTSTIRVKANPQDLETIQNNWHRLENNLATTNKNIEKNTTSTLEAMKRSMNLNSLQGSQAVAHNMQLTVQAIRRNMTKGSTSTEDGLMEIRRQFRVHTAAAAHSADLNFGNAKTAIQNAVQEGAISSEKGLKEIRKLWVSYLKLYGFSESEAQNVAKGNRQDGGPDEGTRGITGSGKTRSGGTARATGGLVNVGTPGMRARDSVPMNLNGVPSVVAPGEQIAVFNRHQQRAANAYLPGGLEGFFASNKKPHYAAGGGIVPVPGFPGERAASSVIPMIEKIAHTYGLVLTDAFGSGHQSPGHTQTGTAADFAGPDAAMDAAVKALVAAGYLVGYDGRYGSADWPGHGPAAGQGGSNAHLHVELGGSGGALSGGGGIEAQNIERQMAAIGLGAMTPAVQGVLDTARAAAQANLDAVAARSLTIPVAGGEGIPGGAPGGAGALSRSQMESYAREALRATQQLGHGGATPGNVAKILELARKESGWNPRAENKTDINAQHGNPSVGLMQVTLDKVGNSRAAGFDPFANMVASIKYQMARYGGLITFSPYAMGGLVDMMSQSQWAKGGMVERPTLMTGEDGRKAPEYIIGTNPAFKKTNLQALTNAASALGVPMARKSKTGTVKPSLVGGQGKDPDNLKEVKQYAKIQAKEADQGRQISIAESRVKEPDTLIKQQGTDDAGNPLYVVDQAKIDGYVGMMKTVKDLYDGMLQIMQSLADQAQRVYGALDRYRQQRTQNIAQLDSQNAINKRLIKSKDKHTSEAAERRYEEGISMREQQVQLRTDASSTRKTVQDDQHDAVYRTQEYGIARQSVVDDMVAVGTKAAADAASETKSAFQEPETVVDQPTPGQAATTRLETELALAEAGYGMNGQLGGARASADIINDLIAANQTVITEAQALLTDTDTSNDQDAYSSITQAANAIKGLRDDLASAVQDPATEYHTMGSAMLDLYRNFGSNMLGSSGGIQGGNTAAKYLGAGSTTMSPGHGGGAASAGPVINLEQNFPTQPDPMTWAKSTLFELNAVL